MDLTFSEVIIQLEITKYETFSDSTLKTTITNETLQNELVQINSELANVLSSDSTLGFSSVTANNEKSTIYSNFFFFV